MEANRSEARVAIAHDWLMSYAGSERCVVEMINAYPNARLLTTLARFEALPTSLSRAEPSFLQDRSVFKKHHKLGATFDASCVEIAQGSQQY